MDGQLSPCRFQTSATNFCTCSLTTCLIVERISPKKSLKFGTIRQNSFGNFSWGECAGSTLIICRCTSKGSELSRRIKYIYIIVCSIKLRIKLSVGTFCVLHLILHFLTHGSRLCESIQTHSHVHEKNCETVVKLRKSVLS